MLGVKFSQFVYRHKQVGIRVSWLVEVKYDDEVIIFLPEFDAPNNIYMALQKRSHESEGLLTKTNNVFNCSAILFNAARFVGGKNITPAVE